MSILDGYKNDITLACQAHSVDSLYVFGSILTSDFSAASDIDLIVSFKDRDVNGYAENYFALKDRLETIFQRRVDLLEDKAIKNPFFKKAIEVQRQLIYGH